MVYGKIRKTAKGLYKTAVYGRRLHPTYRAFHNMPIGSDPRTGYGLAALAALVGPTGMEIVENMMAGEKAQQMLTYAGIGKSGETGPEHSDVLRDPGKSTALTVYRPKWGQLGGNFYQTPGTSQGRRGISYTVRKPGMAEFDVSVGSLSAGNKVRPAWPKTIERELMKNGVPARLALPMSIEIARQTAASTAMIQRKARALVTTKPKARAHTAKGYMSAQWLRRLPQYKKTMVRRKMEKHGVGSEYSLYLTSGINMSTKGRKVLDSCRHLL